MAMPTMAKQSLALAAVTARLRGPTVVAHDRHYYMVTGGKN
jgi:hypothetical protein